MSIAIAPEVFAAYEENGYTVTVDAERITAMCIKDAPKSRAGFKVVYNYRYGSAERLVEHVTKFITETVARKVERAAAKKARADAAKAAKASAAANIKVGDIFYSSWGYDQTNIEFWEVVGRPSPKALIVREIAACAVEGSEGFMSDRVKPAVGQYIGEPVRKMINQYGGFKAHECSNAHPCAADKEAYRSWYA